MKIRYRISSEDYQDAQKLILRFTYSYSAVRVLAIVLFAIAILLLTYANVAMMPNSYNLWLNLRPLLFLLACVLLFPLAYRFRAARAYRRNPTLHREISADLSETGYQAEDGAGAKSSITWDFYDRFLEGKRVFVLRSLSRTFTIVSKASLSDDEIANIRTLLRQSVKKR